MGGKIVTEGCIFSMKGGKRQRVQSSKFRFPFMVRVRAMRTLENAARRWGFYRVAGCDEVGRGCLAGPVVAGAVILNPDVHIAGLADSKTITALERERLHDGPHVHARQQQLLRVPAHPDQPAEGNPPADGLQAGIPTLGRQGLENSKRDQSEVDHPPNGKHITCRDKINFETI